MAIHIGRRKFVITLGSAAAWPLAARAQQGDGVRRVGALSRLAESDPDAETRQLAAEGCKEVLLLGQTVNSYEYVYGDGRRERLSTAIRQIPPGPADSPAPPWRLK